MKIFASDHQFGPAYVDNVILIFVSAEQQEFMLYLALINAFNHHESSKLQTPEANCNLNISLQP